MKTCIKCNKLVMLSKFSPGRNDCQPCRNVARRSRPRKKYNISVLEKFCFKCSTTKSWDEFDKNASRVTGLSDYCKSCIAIKSRRDYEKHNERIRAASHTRYQKIKGTEEYRMQARERQNARLKVDPKYKLKRNLRNRLWYALKKTAWKKNTKFANYIGCSLEELKSHLEKQFTAGMSWDNYGEWHVDHIMPLDSADTEEQLYTLCHYTNLQPLWGEENWSKGAKIS